MTDISTSTTVDLPIGEIKPYWRNPRRIPQEAVDSVARSIELYGYVQPIVVDKDHVIIVGHTRLRALQKLGWTKVPVYISNLSETKAKEYRLVDNRTGELSSWDHDALVTELREFEQGLIDEFFPDLDLEIGQINDAVNEQDLLDATDKIGKIAEGDPAVNHTTDVVCPSCEEQFPVRTRSIPGVTKELLLELVEDAAETTTTTA
jgi:hypothetical protein